MKNFNEEETIMHDAFLALPGEVVRRLLAPPNGDGQQRILGEETDQVRLIMRAGEGIIRRRVLAGRPPAAPQETGLVERTGSVTGQAAVRIVGGVVDLLGLRPPPGPGR
ncbi:MAG: hypothetical protein HOO67_04085 [Candidatus Peribacteraceae bacterium]|nr:hypothetical protein [Candidatus Peribacteraceae bacterium]